MGEKWQTLRCKYPVRTNDPDVAQTLTRQGMTGSSPKPESEGFIIAVQDQCRPKT